MNSIFRYVLGHLSVLSDEELAKLNFSAANDAVEKSDLSDSERREIKHLFEVIQSEISFSHHGILGMKWGVRRYQNKDGTLTSAGLARYRKRADKTPVFGQAEQFTVKTKVGDVIDVEPVKPYSIGQKIISSLLYNGEKNEMGRRGDANYILKDDKGNKIGELSLIDKSPDVAYFDWITIDENHRGKGYATDILNDLLQRAHNSGYSKVEMNALKKPRPLYERIGFTYTDTSNMSIMDRINSFEFGCKHMEYDLTKLSHGAIDGVFKNLWYRTSDGHCAHCLKYY